MQVFDFGPLWGGAGGNIYAMVLMGTECGGSVVCLTDYSPKLRDHKGFYFGLEAGVLQ